MIETRSSKDKAQEIVGEEALRVLREEVEERSMDEFDSGGGRSGDKGAAAEDDGSNAPLPEKVFYFCFVFSVLFF